MQQRVGPTLSYAADAVVRRRPVRWAVVAVAIAWAAYAGGRVRADHLDVSWWGPDPDIAGSLAIDGYRAGYERPYVAAAVVLDAAAIWIAGRASWEPRPTTVAVGTLAAGVGSLLWHGLGLVIDGLFAT